jgi:hypothetical protein
MLMPAFRFRRKNSATVGRLIAGYGELEFLLSVCAGRAIAAKRKIPPNTMRGVHRAKYENRGTKLIFRIRGEKKRIDDASRTVRAAYKSVGLGPELDETLNAMRACLLFRNLFAHCHWARSKKRGLFFINLEESAKLPQKLDLNRFRHASSASLQRAEDYFWYTFQMLVYLMDEFTSRTRLGLIPSPSKPRKRPVLNPDTKLFPYKSP